MRSNYARFDKVVGFRHSKFIAFLLFALLLVHSRSCGLMKGDLSQECTNIFIGGLRALGIIVHNLIDHSKWLLEMWCLPYALSLYRPYVMPSNHTL